MLAHGSTRVAGREPAAAASQLSGAAHARPATEGEIRAMTAVLLDHDAEISLGSTTPECIGDYLRHQHGRAVISRITDASALIDKQDATWIFRAGLADSSGFSFESKSYPGCYLRHQNGAVFHHDNDGSDQFAADATFTASSGRNGRGVSLASFNYPDHYLRHWQGEIYIARIGGPELWERTASWTDDVSWLPRPGWAS
jgi:non-reducing end alpha-L-arabinofuranosidase